MWHKRSDELGRFLADRRMLKSLKIEGCSNLGGFVLCSSSLCTLWLSDLCSLSKMVISFSSIAIISCCDLSFLFHFTILLLFSLSLDDFLCSNLLTQVFNCPNLKEISLEFSRQENDNTDLITMADSLGRGCPRLQNIHIASCRLSHSVVLALTAAQLRLVKYSFLSWLLQLMYISVAINNVVYKHPLGLFTNFWSA